MSKQGVAEPLDPERKEAIRKQAYVLWHEQGRPEGKDREHWLQAERESNGHGDQLSAPAALSMEERKVPEQGALGTSISRT